MSNKTKGPSIIQIKYPAWSKKLAKVLDRVFSRFDMEIQERRIVVQLLEVDKFNLFVVNAYRRAVGSDDDVLKSCYCILLELFYKPEIKDWLYETGKIKNKGRFSVDPFVTRLIHDY